MATAATALRIGPADHGRAMTLDEFHDADEEPGYRYELAGGVLEVTNVPNDPHGEVVCNLYELMSQYRKDNPGVIHRYGGAGEFRLWVPGMASGRNPDVAVVLAGAPRDLQGNRAPALAIEVVSRGGEDRDYKVKRDEYLAFGLLEYWIVDPALKRVTVLVRDGFHWAERVAEGDQPIPSHLLPGITTTVEGLWAGMDEGEGEGGPAA